MSDQNIQNIERKVDAQIAKANREKMTTLIGYTIIIVIIFGYMFFLRSLTNEFTPESVVEVAIGTAQEKIPEAREQLKSQFVDNADEMLNEQVDKFMTMIPEKREELQTFASNTLSKNLIVAQDSFGELFTNTLQAGRSELEPMLEHVENAKTQQEFEEAFYLSLKQQLNEPSFAGTVASYGDTLHDLADRLEYLREGRGLSTSEQLERELLVSLRSVAIRAEKATKN